MMTAYSAHPAAHGPVVDVIIESPGWEALADPEAVVRRAIAAVVVSHDDLRLPATELTVLLCDNVTVAGLNARWRNMPVPTNVLAFPAARIASLPPNGAVPLGDIAIAYETVAREAGEQGKAVSDHLSHLVVHGFLHLLGYDHQTDGDAGQMEQLERDVLARIGIADPYLSRDGND